MMISVSESALRSLLAEAYFAASKNEEGDMLVTAEAFEFIRVEVLKISPLTAWSRLSLDRSKFEHPFLIPQLVKLKNGYIELLYQSLSAQIKQAYNANKENGWRLWFQYYIEALLQWRGEIYDRLCYEEFSHASSKEPFLLKLKQFNKWIIEGRWADCYDIYLEILQSDLITNEERALTEVIIGEIELYWFPNYKDSIQHFERAKSLLPNSARIVRAFAEYYLKLGENDNGRSYILNAMSLDNGDIDNYQLMGDSYRDEGNTEVAQQWYNDAINFNFLESSPYEKFIGLCNDEVFFKANREKIASWLEKISQLEPDSSYTNILYNAYRSAGNTFFINNEIEQCEKYYRTAIDMHPDWITAYIDLGNVLASKELHEKAEVIFNEAKDLDKDCFDLNWALATWNEQKENLSAARNFYLKCIKIRPRWTDYINNVIEELYINNNKENELIKEYKSAVENEPSEENRISLAIGYEKLKQYDLAVEQYKDILKTDSVNASVWNRLGNIYYDQSDYTSAISNYQNAVKFDASTAVYFNNLGLAYRQAGDWTNSIDAYKTALQLNPGDNESMNAIGIAYYRMGNYEEARPWYEKAIKALKPEDTEVQLATYLANIGLAFYDEGNTEKAIDYFIKAVDKDPNSDAALNYSGNAFFARQDYEQARIYYNKAIQIQPENAVYLSNAGLTYYFQANYSKAIDLFEQSLQYDAEYLPALNYGGNCYLLLHNYQEAESFYRKCISLNSSESFYYSNLGISLVKQNKFDEAEDNLNHAISLNEQNLEAVTYLGFIAYKKGDVETAKNYYNKAYPNQLQDPTLYYQLLDPENTTHEAQKNLEENPDDFMSLWQLGSVNYMNQDFDESKKYFRKALDLLFADEDAISAAVENFKKIDKQQWNYSIGLLKELFKDDEALSKQLADIQKQVDA